MQRSTAALANRALDALTSLPGDDSLELFKELMPSQTLMQLRDNRSGVARETRAWPFVDFTEAIPMLRLTSLTRSRTRKAFSKTSSV